jgi:hypothetical protein
MHPFSLNDKELDLVGGGLSAPVGGSIIIGGGGVTSMMYGEEGGVQIPPLDPPYETTQAIGEEGGGAV